MRTTIRIPDAQRERLLKMAADRGDRGCARIVQEAVMSYLAQQESGPSPRGWAAADTRAERAWLLFGWLWEEAAGLVGLARSFRSRLRGSTAG
jgi:predicted transcriptional regulator